MTPPDRPGRPPLDLLRAPILGPFLRWRHARTVLQSIFLGLAILIILDGLFGPQLAPLNLAGVLPWVHWRGFVVLALLVIGNLFCMACPFMLPRRLAKRFLPASRSWPRVLRSKWAAVALLLLFFWAYEAFNLWASPWLTAWVALSYFILAFVIDGFFKGASFCKHLCPIGQFHFVNGMISPTEVAVRDPEVCERCRTKDCIRGRYAASPGASAEGPEPLPIRMDRKEGVAVLEGGAAPGRALGRRGLVQGGCELALFQPRKEGNLDCTFCLECIHACPHDNVGILVRSPAAELERDPVRSGIGRISRRPDFAALALLLVFAAFVNAFGMVEPVFALQSWMASTLGIPWESVTLALFFGIGLVVVPFGLVGATAAASRRLSGGGDSLSRRISTYGWALVPLGFGMWAAHYLFHLLIGGLTLVPLVQEYLADLGFSGGPAPRSGTGAVVPESWIFPVEILLLQGGLFLSLIVGYRIARREESAPRTAGLAFLPWAVLATLLTGLGIWLLVQPMEMRGTFQAI